MVSVLKKIIIRRNEKSIEALALFDTGSRGSYISEEIAKKLGYEKFDKPKLIPLAVKNKFAEIIGDIVVELEIDGYRLPERELLGVIKDLAVDVIIGINIMEKYGIYIENDELKFRYKPPSSAIF